MKIEKNNDLYCATKSLKMDNGKNTLVEGLVKGEKMKGRGIIAIEYISCRTDRFWPKVNKKVGSNECILGCFKKNFIIMLCCIVLVWSTSNCKLLMDIF